MTDFDDTIEQYHSALAEFVKGNPQLVANTFSHTDEVSLANPFGSVFRGWEAVAETLKRAASHFSGEGTIRFQNIVQFVADEFAFLVEFEPHDVTFDGKEGAKFTLRVTSIFHKENGVWKLIHRHADPLADLQEPKSILRHE